MYLTDFRNSLSENEACSKSSSSTWFCQLGYAYTPEVNPLANPTEVNGCISSGNNGIEISPNAPVIDAALSGGDASGGC